ncbi:MAG: glucose-1-phosphate adenylyltransferase [Vicinamibacteria bacterium]
MNFQRDTRVLALVLAGGRGERLHPLTAQRSKPAVPFGGKYRIVDFVLSNLINSSITATFVLTQYKAQSLLEHLQMAWTHSTGRNNFLTAVPAQMQSGEFWYRGTADAIYQNLALLNRTHPQVVAVFGADHIYKMNVGQMVDFHVRKDASATVACLPMPSEEAAAFGVIKVNADWRVIGFEEKPERPACIPDRPGYSLVSMGNYTFDSVFLTEVLKEDAEDHASSHDFGRSILPKIFDSVPVYAYDFQTNRIPMEHEAELAYWRDVGTIEAYYDANLDLKDVRPRLNLYNWDWPIHSVSYNDPPAKFVFDDSDRRGYAIQSIVSSGCILAGGRVKDSVLGRNVFIDEGAEVDQSVIHDNVRIGRGARIRRAIVDKNNHLAEGTVIGYDLDRDRERHFVSEEGIVVLGRGADTPESRARDF